MQIIYFGGYSTKNIEEGEHIVSTLEKANYKVFFNQWRHWKGTEINTMQEVEEDINSIISQFKSEEEFGIIGKSIGSYAAIRLAETLLEKGKKIKFVLLLGIPAADNYEDTNRDYRRVIGKSSFPTYIIQNSEDEHGGSASVTELLDGLLYNMMVMDANNHRYDYPDEILQIVNKAAF